MELIEKINKEAENGAFEIAFRDGNWGLHSEQVLLIFKALIKRHNDVVDLVNELSIRLGVNCTDLKPPHYKQKKMTEKSEKAKHLKAIGYSVREIMKIMNYKSPRSVQVLLKK